MEKTLKFALLIWIVTLVAGCKLAVIVVEGGEVISDRSGTCMAGSVCIIEVTDTDFRDVFEVVPNAGWYFDSWNSGGWFFCGGSSEPVCILSLQEHKANTAVEEIVASSETFYIMPIFKRVEPDSIVVDGRSVIAADRMWLQPVDFVGYSYSQIDEVCPDGVCSGTLPGSTVDLTDYTWASSDDIRLLFQAYRKADRVLVRDFEYTWMRGFPSGDAPSVDALVNDQYVAVVFGDGEDGSTEFRTFVNLSNYVIDGTGAWFWKAIE